MNSHAHICNDNLAILNTYSPLHPADRTTTVLGFDWIDGAHHRVRSAAAARSGVATVGTVLSSAEYILYTTRYSNLTW